MALHARLDGAVDIQFFDLDIEHVGDSAEALGRIKNLQQFLFLFDGKLQVRGDYVRKLCRIFHAHGRDHGLVIQRLAQLYVLLEQSGDALHARFDLRVHFHGIAGHANGSLHIAIGIGGLQKPAALDAFHQNFNVSIGQFQALHDVDDGADLVDLVRLGFVDGCVMLGGKENFLIRGQCLFEGAHAGLAAHYERRHHIRENDDIADRHHGQLFGFEFFLGCGH